MNPAIGTILATRLMGTIRTNRYEYPRNVAQAWTAEDVSSRQFAEITRRAVVYLQAVSQNGG